MHYEQQTIFRHGSSDKLEQKSPTSHPNESGKLGIDVLCFLQY